SGRSALQPPHGQTFENVTTPAGLISPSLAVGVVRHARTAWRPLWVPANLRIGVWPALLLLGGVIGLVPSSDLAATVAKLASLGLGVLLYLWLVHSAGQTLRVVAATLVALGVVAALAGAVLVDRNSWKLNWLNDPVYAAFAHVPRFSDLAFNQNALAA